MDNFEEVQRSLLNTIDVLVNKKCLKCKKDYTLTGVLKSVTDNICVVTIDGEDCNCKCVDKLQLSIGDVVNVKVPSSNYSEKYIESKLGIPTII